MAIAGYYCPSLKTHIAPLSLVKLEPSFSCGFVSLPTTRKLPRKSFIVRSVAAPVEVTAGFDEMVSGTQRKYYMLGGKGGVGKTSCAASLAVKFANNGHPTLVVSTDPAHSLSDSFAQDLTGGALVPVEGPYSPLFALEINPEKAREEFRSASQTSGGSGIKDFMDGMGLGAIADQLGELKLGELLDTPPPGLDEAIAISKACSGVSCSSHECSFFLRINLNLSKCLISYQVMQFLESQEYNMFTRIVFDTAPTGHTLRLLSLPDFLDASIGKILKLRQKISSATSAIKSVFGQGDNNQQVDAADKLERLRERMIKVRELFRDTNSTEFVIVTIPTVMAISESSRLSASLKKESVPVKRLIVNQVIPPSASDCKFCAMKRKDQMRALDMIKSDPELSNLIVVQAPLVDVEIRGVPALQFLAILDTVTLQTSSLYSGISTIGWTEMNGYTGPAAKYDNDAS
ncbi:OLC1v1026057C1 [Oldenlandia corymbosa var. corymbosa]|uniref:OLC1v1026057C1 n=1 Tax=Oldenlandia corymbosa var. corymbosa TaxID=529605 RepID=A0AAV1C908_OLDCO|nr:OLC1v1026057C1 [Oldenlandia corymbosa var. corymbosa]